MALFPTDPIERQSYILGLRIAGDFGATIAVPVILFVLVGQWADTSYGIEPWGTILAFVLAGLITGKIIYRKAKVYGRMYRELTERKQKRDSQDNQSK